MNAKKSEKMIKLVIFDLDGTLAESKTTVDAEMSLLLKYLLKRVKVAVISGADWPQFEKQLLTNFTENDQLINLSIIPTCGTKFYKFTNGWEKIYSEDLLIPEKEKIILSLKEASNKVDLRTEKSWGEIIEDRGSQITFSALGQFAPLEEKKTWDPDFMKRKKIKAILEKLIPEFSIRMGGTTSLDVTKPGIDKAYGINKLKEILGIELSEMIFIGDALFPGGNDYPVKQTGVVSIRVKDPQDVKQIIKVINTFIKEMD